MNFNLNLYPQNPQKMEEDPIPDTAWDDESMTRLDLIEKTMKKTLSRMSYDRVKKTDLLTRYALCIAAFTEIIGESLTNMIWAGEAYRVIKSRTASIHEKIRALFKAITAYIYDEEDMDLMFSIDYEAVKKMKDSLRVTEKRKEKDSKNEEDDEPINKTFKS